MSGEQNAIFPFREPIATTDLHVSPRWQIWFRDLFLGGQKGAIRIGTAQIKAATASKGVTPFSTATLTAGQYCVVAIGQFITAASVNSSLIVTISFTRKAAGCSIPSTALVSNDPTLPMSFVCGVSIDAGTPISYSTTVVNNVNGVYDVDLVLLSINI